jgi:hypothetical protein
LEIDEIDDFLNLESSLKMEDFPDQGPSYGLMKSDISSDYQAVESSDDTGDAILKFRRLPKQKIQIIVPMINKVNRFIFDTFPIHYPAFQTWYEKNYLDVHKVEVEASKLINILIFKTLEIEMDSFRINEDFLEAVNAFQGFIKIKSKTRVLNFGKC